MSGVGSSVGTYRIEVVRERTETIARDILDSLPEWFGRPESLEEYVAATNRFPTLVAYSENGKAVGFLSLERHTSVAAEVHVIGVARDQRGKGCGRQLIEQAATILKIEGVHWLTVKTLAASHPDPHYAETRRFYEASGFEPLEVFPDLWDEDTPCFMMVRPIG
jgi:GNAT superfamily N-acetyltransferase